MRVRSYASPSAYEAYLRAELAMARGDPAGAAAQLDLAVIADPADGFLAARRAEVLLARGPLADALRAAEEATRQHPAAAAAWIALGETRRALGDADGVAEAMQRAAALAPDDPDVRAAVSAQHGGSAAQVARARRDAPEARPGDQNLARHALDPRGEGRRWSVTRRRLLAAEQRARGDWAAVDRTLTPGVLADPTNVQDREAVIEARARDGRPRDAAALAGGLPAATPAPRRALAWWLAGDPARAVSAASTPAVSEDPLAVRVHAQALGAQGDVAGALALLATVPPEAPWHWAGERSGDGWGLPGRDRVDAVGHDVSNRYRAFACARLTAADLLARGGHFALAESVLRAALELLAGRPDGAASRDALRLALLERLALPPAREDRAAERGTLRGALETVWARHRAALGARDLAALQQRSGDPREDAAADAWIVILARDAGGGVTQEELRAALARAERVAPDSPLTRRARARFDEGPRGAP